MPRDVPYKGVINLTVDARDVKRGIFHVRERIPVEKAGSFTLMFPKWIPGNHAPSARIEGISGLVVRAAGRAIAWKRDDVDMNVFRVVVPEGSRELSLQFEYLSPTTPEQGRVVMTASILNLQWFSLTAYPAGYFARRIKVEPEILLPDDWEFSSQLHVASRNGNKVQFERTDQETLLDSPVFAGAYFQRYYLGKSGSSPAYLDVFADNPKLTKAATGAIEDHAELIRQASFLFGEPPFRAYRFMLALTDELGGIGTEHLASSENTRPLDYLSDWRGGALLPHELVHSWNGKARRPADLWSADFNQPMRNSLLWVYEGQTQFWGFVLAARSGLMSKDQVLDVFARLAAAQQAQPGRSWRPLSDTGNDAIITNYLVNEPWPSWRRSLADSYSEADLIWLEVDGIIREMSGEKRGLDNFAKSFFKGGGERPSLYTQADVVAELNRIQPYDWTAFFAARLQQVGPDAPSDWLRRSGYRLRFSTMPSTAFTEHEARTKRVDLRNSIGLLLSAGESGRIIEVIWDSPAFAAGIVAGSLLRTVNGEPYSAVNLRAAIDANRNGSRPLRLGYEILGRSRTATLDYRDGLRFPRLERDPRVPDRLSVLLRPRTG